jgi:hypothetical protein
MIVILRPPDAAGPLHIGATGQDAVDTLRQLGVPLVLCRAAGSRPGWGVHRPSGLFIGVYLDAHDHVEAIEFGRPGDHTDDTVTYNEFDVFATPAAGLVTKLRHHTSSTKRRTDTHSPHPTYSWPSGDQPHPTRQTTRTAATSKASCSPGPATTTRQQTSQGNRVQSTGLDNCSRSKGNGDSSTPWASTRTASVSWP